MVKRHGRTGDGRAERWSGSCGGEVAVERRSGRDGGRRWGTNDGTRSLGRAFVLKKRVLCTNTSGTTGVVQQQCHPHSDWWEAACDQKKARLLEGARWVGTVPVGENSARAAAWGRKTFSAGLSSWVQLLRDFDSHVSDPPPVPRNAVSHKHTHTQRSGEIVNRPQQLRHSRSGTP